MNFPVHVKLAMIGNFQGILPMRLDLRLNSENGIGYFCFCFLNELCVYTTCRRLKIGYRSCGTMVSKLLLLLFCLIKYCETNPVGNTARSVTGKKGENATLSCEFEDRDISDIVLNRLSKKILVCENEKCKSENSRLFKKGSCDVIIKDLVYSDAGKYILRVYYTNDQTGVKQQIREYHLHIHDEISVMKGEDLKLDVLLSNAYKVEKNSNEGWTEVWRRGHGVSSDRLTDHDGNLTINEFTVTDTGTYRALDSNNEALITVTVTESGTHLRTKTDDPKANDTEHNIRFWTLSVGLPVLLAFCWL